MNLTYDFSGEVAVVTGAARGVGQGNRPGESARPS